MRIQVVHFGQQCPWLPWVIDQADRAATELGGSLTAIDVSGRPDLARQYQLFFPFLTIIDERSRVAAPVPTATLVAIARAADPTDDAPALAVASALPRPALPERIIPLTRANLTDACALCGAPDGCAGKGDWLATQPPVPDGGLDCLGYLAYVGERPVAALELLPATAVPYPLPGPLADAAFITCVYPSAEPDYRGALLDRLRSDLPRLGCARVLVVAGRRTPFPNGPAALFTAHGFRELQVLHREQLRETADELVLLELAR